MIYIGHVLFSFILSLFIHIFFIYKIKLGKIFYDYPIHRSSHNVPTLKIGGMIFFPILFFLNFIFINHGPLNFIIYCASIIFIFSLLDDLIEMPITLRLFIHFFISYIFLFQFSDFTIVTLIFFLVSLVWITNLYNFMDGIDGLAGSMTLVGILFLSIPLYLKEFYSLLLFNIYILFIIIPFFYFNFFRSKIFLGDSGAVTIGFLVGCIGLYGSNYGIWPIWYPTLIFSTFGADATLTVLIKVFNRENPLKPHKHYFFHKLIDLGVNKKIIVLIYLIFMFFSSSLAFFLLYLDTISIYIPLIIYLTIILLILSFIHFLWLRYNFKNNQ